MSSALHQAARSGQIQTVRQLVAEGADVDAADASGRSPLYVAGEAGHSDVVQLLLAAGAGVASADSRGRTPLHAAAMERRLEVMQQLLEAGANVHAGDKHGWTPLHAAACRQHDLVQLLLAAGVDVDPAQGWTSLHPAVGCGHHEVVQQLLRKGANPRVRDVHGETALQTAACSWRTDIVQLLLEAWGQPQITADDLVAAAQEACSQRFATFACLAKELWKLYPAKLPRLDLGRLPALNSQAVAAALDARASDVSGRDEQQAALRNREQAVESEKAAVQQLLVAVAGMARSAQQHHA
jgi:ankyrin repeat protein